MEATGNGHLADGPDAASSWDSYWRSGDANSAWSAMDAGHPAVQSFWDDFFAALSPGLKSPAMIDIACGNGAVVAHVLAQLGTRELAITCVDVSAVAIGNISARFKQVEALICDARQIPADSHSFDIVTSQFGVEYAGIEAVVEAARLVAPGGRIALLMHHSAGSIYRDCMAGRAAVSAVRDAQFLALAGQMFQAGFAAVRGADRAPYDEAAARLAPALKVVEAAIAQHGAQVSAGAIARLYEDVARIHGRLPHYDPNEVLEWLERMERELGAYLLRASSMLASALDAGAFERACEAVRGSGCVIEQARALRPQNKQEPLAWALTAMRPSFAEH